MTRWTDETGIPADLDIIINPLLCGEQPEPEQETAMPTLFKGSATYRRFRLIGDMLLDYRGIFAANALKHAFRPIPSDDPTIERSAGWVNIHDHLDAERGDLVRLLGGLEILKARILREFEQPEET